MFDEREKPAPIRRIITAGEWWLKGYSTAYKGEPPVVPAGKGSAAAYIRGYEEGRRARK